RLRLELLSGLVAGNVAPDVFQRLEREIEGPRGRRAEQPVRVVVRAQERLALVRAAVSADGARVEQAPVEAIAVLEARGGHAAGRPYGTGGLVRVRDVERPVLAAQEPRGCERLQLLALADVEPLPDVDEGGYRRVPRPQRPRD